MEILPISVPGQLGFKIPVPPGEVSPGVNGDTYCVFDDNRSGQPVYRASYPG